jgi:superfamily II DNA or RNA helicase
MAKADVLKNLLTGAFANCPIRWGLTGTVPKAQYELEGIVASLGPVVGGISAHELQEAGHLANCHVNVIQTQEWKEFGGYAEELKYLVTDEDRIKHVSVMLKAISETGNTLILVDRIECGRQLTENLEGSVFVNGNVKTTVRKEEYDEVRTATNKIIVATYGVAAVGARWSLLFAELGYNTTGFFRFGLSLNAYKK